MTTNRVVRAVGALGLAVLAALAVAAPASAAAPRLTPADFDFADCPALPAGLDAAAWRCEVHLATGDLTIGRVTVRGLALRLTHAEGPLPDGTSGQIFGGLRARPVHVAGYTVQLRYGGYADLIGNGPDPGGVYFLLAVRGRGQGTGCAIGSLADPIRTHAVPVGDTVTIPTDPPIREFTLQDNAFTVPAASGCRRDGAVDARFGLPAGSGNALTLRAAYTYRMYS